MILYLIKKGGVCRIEVEADAGMRRATLQWLLTLRQLEAVR